MLFETEGQKSLLYEDYNFKNCLRKRSFRHILCLHQYVIN